MSTTYSFPVTFSIFPIIFFVVFFTVSTDKTTSALDVYGTNLKSKHFVIEMPKTLQAMLHNDANRQRTFLRKQSVMKKHQRVQSIGKIRRELVEETRNNDDGSNDRLNVVVDMAVHSGADYGIGQYLVAFKAGTPSQKLNLIVDTGSDLTWMNCKYSCNNDPNKCSGISRQQSKVEVFEADNSSSFNTIPCSSQMCKVDLSNLFSLAMCPFPFTPCGFDYRYSDGSSAIGFFANETVTVGLTNGRKAKLDKILMGCSQSSQGSSFRGQVEPDGVLGLGFSKSSFALRATDAFGGKFSYCLPHHLSPKNVLSHLTFSSPSYQNGATSKIYTTLGAIGTNYAVNIRGISVGNELLKIPGEIWDVNGVGGAILDTGSSLTFLALPAYKPIVAALTVPLNKFERLDMKMGQLEYCFNATGFNEMLDVPRLIFHFQDGTRFQPPVKNYVIDAADGVKCLGLVPAVWPGVSVIGNIMQQNHVWEYDLVNGKLGFAPSSCT
ncbi:NAC domain-containing protein 29-like [Heracleum sosnowskyi]|uniref:NAC domain-containing protein 29-like n=1 Tax=Heracleum sosnowskyi TaxID=360622 RepID=A0AAD8J5G3_9APIA|nr:NAC domain-containing protein 29-like [Heracleum sosnowskyi]